jgi:hypothetical protein
VRSQRDKGAGSRGAKRSWLEWLGLKQPEPPSQPQVDRTYHAVSISAGPSACSAAHRFAGHRFLSRQAPPLPLPTCDAFNCQCRFRHHQDRRSGARRRSDIGLMPGAYAGSERRRVQGRRKDDLLVAE